MQTETDNLSMRKKQKKAWVNTELLFLVFSFALPYVMALVFCLTSSFTFAEIFGASRLKAYSLTSVIIFICLSAVSVYLFLQKEDLFYARSTKKLIVATVLLSFIISTITANAFSPYAVVLVFCGLIFTTLSDEKLAYFVNAVVPTIFFFCYYFINPVAEIYTMFVVAFVQIISGCVVLALTKNECSRFSYFIKCLSVGVFVAFPLGIVVSFLKGGVYPEEYVMDGLYAAASQFTSYITFLAFLPLFEVIFGLYSNFKLEEMCSSNARLMKKLAKEAPGTYNHSIAMATLAQDCAKAIGENPALAKAGACYHDIGKMDNPICFSENQTDYNPHDDLIPEVSVAMITQHTKKGAEIIRRAGLPEAIALIAEEHHGDQTVGYFLYKSSKMTDEKMDQNRFRYKGPRPSTKISGIIMIVDTIEAATRAQGINKDEKIFREFIHGLIADKMNAGQFSNCPLTFKDIAIIEETLLKSIPALYHQRIKYSQ